jgi:predicted O-methyltransferase YrrM
VTLSFCPELDALYRTRRAIGRTGRVFDQVGALSTTQNVTILRALMMERRPNRTLEIGLSFGGSALALAASHRDLEQPPEHQHVAIDPFQSTVWDDCGREVLERAGLSGFVDVRETLSSLALPALVSERPFGLIYVDGSHLFEDVFVDAYFCARLLSDDGMMLFDDCTDPHVAKALRFLTTNWQGFVAEVDLSPYRPDGQSVRYKIAKQLGKTQLRAFRRSAPLPREWDAAFHDF